MINVIQTFLFGKHMFLGYVWKNNNELSYDKVFIFSVAPYWDWSSLRWNQFRICQSRLKSLSCGQDAANFLKYAHESWWLMSNWYGASGWCSCSLLASFGHPSVKPPIVPAALHVPCTADSLSRSKGHYWLRLARLKMTVGSDTGMWVCWDRGRQCCAARLCKAHASVGNIEPGPWQSSMERLLNRPSHNGDHAPAGGVFMER